MKPKTAEERVKVGGCTVRVDGKVLMNCANNAWAERIAEHVRELLNTTAEMCCAAVRSLDERRDPPHNEFTDAFDEGYAGCKKDAEDAIRNTTGVKP